MTKYIKIREQAVRLRERGKTLREIGVTLGISSSTAHLWTRQVRLTDAQKRAIWEKHRQAFQDGRKRVALKQRQIRESEVMKYRKLGQDMVGKLSRRELLLVGAALYWSEGFKRDSRLGFANSDPVMIRLFLKWLFEVGKVPKEDVRVRVGVNISYEQDVKRIEAVWTDLIGIPLQQFQKPFFQKSKWVKEYKDRGEYLGVLRVRANRQRRLFLTIKGLIEGLRLIGR